MKKLAILIGAPGQTNTDKHLKGVYSDMANYQRFLQSPSGGGWEKNEIGTIKNPDKAKLVAAIKNLGYFDYILTVFSGHGAYSIDGKMILGINSTEHLFLSQLVSKAPKQMFIIDACRGFFDSGLYGFLGEELRRFPSKLTKLQARNLYNKYLTKCENGLVVCYSCSVGESSWSSNDGGQFTTSLLDTTQQWIETPSQYNILPIHAAFTKAKNYVVRYAPRKYKQTPQLAKSNARTYWYPFAIRKAEDLFWD